MRGKLCMEKLERNVKKMQNERKMASNLRNLCEFFLNSEKTPIFLQKSPFSFKNLYFLSKILVFFQKRNLLLVFPVLTKKLSNYTKSPMATTPNLHITSKFPIFTTQTLTVQKTLKNLQYFSLPHKFGKKRSTNSIKCGQNPIKIEF
jgi:hypothetical protein